MSVTVKQARLFLRRREEARREEGRRRAALLRSRLPDLARLLRERFGATRVQLFGSLALGTAHGSSDIDLAVEGMPPDVYFEALGEVMAVAGCPVDLVRIETASASLRDRIAADGEDL